MNKPGISIPRRLTALVALLAFIFNLAPLQAALSQTRRSLILPTTDSLGRRVGRTLPGGQGESVAYNAAGNVTGRTDFNGTVTSYGYDALNRLLNRTSNHAQAAASNVSFTYTALGQRATMTDGHGTTLYGYDSRGRLVSKACPEGTLGYTYDAAGNLTSITSSNANGVSVVYRHDALNRLAEVQENGSEITRYDYDAVGNLERVRAPNGVAHTYGYNALNRLVGLDVNKGATLLASYGYAQLRSGHRSGAVESFASTGGAAPLNRSVRYSYDALYRLRNETVSASAGPGGSVGYGLDPVGNRISRTSSVAGLASQAFSYDANDRLNTDTYDANGNTRTGRIGMDAAGAETAPHTATDTYDSENRLLTHNGASGPVQIVYDGDGNKVRETINGQVFSYLVDTQNPTGYAQVLEEQLNGSVIRTYTFGHDLLVQDQRGANGAWSATWYGYDGHGSVRLLTDGVGNVTDRYDYDAFGALIHAEGTTFNRYRYCGEQYDSALGLYYLRARLMNPLTGRFWTADSYEGSKGDPASLHKYLYANADPVNRLDPSGRYSLAELNSVNGIIGQLTKMTTTVLHYYSRAQTVLGFIDMLRTIAELSQSESIESALRRAAKETLSELTDLDFDHAINSLLNHTDDLVLFSTAAWAPHLAANITRIEKFVIYLPNIGNIPYAELPALRLPRLKYKAVLAMGSGGESNYGKQSGRLTGLGVGLKGEARPKQIWRMDYHKAHGSRGTGDYAYIDDKPFHYHVLRP